MFYVTVITLCQNFNFSSNYNLVSHNFNFFNLSVEFFIIVTFYHNFNFLCHNHDSYVLIMIYQMIVSLLWRKWASIVMGEEQDVGNSLYTQMYWW